MRRHSSDRVQGCRLDELGSREALLKVMSQLFRNVPKKDRAQPSVRCGYKNRSERALNDRNADLAIRSSSAIRSERHSEQLIRPIETAWQRFVTTAKTHESL